jgi:hypothetical protein
LGDGFPGLSLALVGTVRSGFHASSNVSMSCAIVVSWETNLDGQYPATGPSLAQLTG